VNRAYLGGHDMRAEESFSNWGHMRKSNTHRQSNGQNTAAHSEIVQIKLDHNFLPILCSSVCSR
jgi:hypothetical protein